MTPPGHEGRSRAEITQAGRPRTGGWWGAERRALLLQVFGTLAVLGWLPDNGIKLAAMAVFWVIGFGTVSLVEAGLYPLVCLLFVMMDEGALRQGVFRFLHPDLAGLPIFEFGIWGFYVLNALRFVGCQPGERFRWIALGMAAIFATCFLTINDPIALALAAGVVVVVSLRLLRSARDFASAGYMLGMGVLVEYVGVGTGQWIYPGAPLGGVPPWSFVMWAGIGLFSRAILAPLVCRGTPAAGTALAAH